MRYSIALHYLITILMMGCTTSGDKVTTQYYSWNNMVSSQMFGEIKRQRSSGYTMVENAKNSFTITVLENGKLDESCEYKLVNDSIVLVKPSIPCYEARAYLLPYPMKEYRPENQVFSDKFPVASYMKMSEKRTGDTLILDLIFSPDGLNKVTYITFEQNNKIIQQSKSYYTTSAWTRTVQAKKSITKRKGYGIKKAKRAFTNKKEE